MHGQRALETIIAVVAFAVFASGCEEDDASRMEMSPATGGQADAGAGALDARVQMMNDAAGLLDASGVRDASLVGDGAASAPDTDYAKPENWLCRPGHDGACAVDLDTTIVKADGTLELEKFTPAADPAIDCFYVYPTVSVDATANSDLVPGPEEQSVVRAQFARFAQHCRLYAPMYRQVTLTSLRASIAGTATMPDRALGYRDVLAAWRHYLEHDNQGRGVILVGHSQGSGILVQLIREQIDPDPDKTPFIAAFLPGTNFTVPDGQMVGGSFKKVPVCKSIDELGCVISYVSFRASTPPTATARFGSTSNAREVVACANPAALGGGSAELHAYLSTAGAGQSALPMPAWVNGDDPAKVVKTPFVSVPGMLSGECKLGNQGYYLAVTIKGDPADPRVDDIVGDVVTNGQLQADWGLHLIDVHLGMGNLLDIAKAKADAFEKR